MQDRRDQVQAHSFVAGRLVSAMLSAEPDSPFTPQRRFVVGWVCGLIVGVLVIVACGIYGLIVPGGNRSWQAPGVLIVENETGTAYLFVDNELRPVLNYASVRLILGGAPTIVKVSSNSLRDVAHGLPVGIEAAPDHLPDVERLDGRQWQVCSGLRPDAGGADQPFVTVWVGAIPMGRAAGEDRALVVRTPAGQVYLAWNNRRLRIPSAAVLSALGYAAAAQYPVGWAWVNALPPGPDLVGGDVAGRGQPGPVVDGKQTTVGQLFVLAGPVAGGVGGQYYVVNTDGLSPMTATGAALLLADPRTTQAYPGGAVRPLALTQAALAIAPMSRDRSVNEGHPATPPKPAAIDPGEVPCLQLTMDPVEGPQVRVALGTAQPAPKAVPRVVVSDRRLADRVVVEPGAGLLIQDQPAPGVADGALYLLVDTGVRYPLAGREVAGMLGYGAVSATLVPAALLDLIPSGRSLDPEAARATLAVAPAVQAALSTGGGSS